MLDRLQQPPTPGNHPALKRRIKEVERQESGKRSRVHSNPTEAALIALIGFRHRDNITEAHTENGNTDGLSDSSLEVVWIRVVLRDVVQERCAIAVR